MKNVIYLDNGATSFPKPEEVYSFMDYFYRHYGVNPGRSGYDLCLEAGQMVEKTRQLLTQFFNGDDPNRLCFTANSTDALNLIIFGMLKEGDHAITTTLEHNSVLRPLYHLWKWGGVEVDYIPFSPLGFVSPEDIKRRIKKNTRLVIVNHGSNVIGTVQPLREIGTICRENNIPFAIDASQTAGQVPIDLKESLVDVIAFTGHKSLMGPTGIGGLYVGQDIEIRFTRAGGTGVRSAQRTHLEEYPYRLEYGTLNLLGIAGLYAGVNWVNKQGVENIHHQEMQLLVKLRDGLREIDGVTMYCQDSLENHIAVFLFNVDGLEATETATLLDVDYNIACRVRFGIGPFNTEEQIDQAIAAVREIAAFARRKRNK